MAVLYNAGNEYSRKSWMTTEWWDAKLKYGRKAATDVSAELVVGAAMMIGAFLDGESELNNLRALHKIERAFK